MKRFVAGVGKTFNYAADGTLLWVGKTNLDNSIEITTGSEEVAAGEGNGLQFIFHHTSRMNVTQTDQQFNLSLMAKSLGGTIATGADVWKEENVTLTASAGVVLGTPVSTFAGAIYGWVDLADGSVERVTFTGQNFTVSGQSSGVVCVRYYETNAAARQLAVSANIIPAIVRTVIEATLFSGDPQNVSGSSIIGRAQIEVPQLQLNGSASLSLTTTGVANTPVTGMALASPVAGCSSNGIYATITEIIDSANWYDDINIIAPQLDPIALVHPAGTYTMVVWAVPTNGDAPFIIKNSELTFTSGTTGVATVGVNTGVISTAGAGNSIITVTITAKNTVKATANVTVTT